MASTRIGSGARASASLVPWRRGTYDFPAAPDFPFWESVSNVIPTIAVKNPHVFACVRLLFFDRQLLKTDKDREHHADWYDARSWSSLRRPDTGDDYEHEIRSEYFQSLKAIAQ